MHPTSFDRDEALALLRTLVAVRSYLARTGRAAAGRGVAGRAIAWPRAATDT